MNLELLTSLQSATIDITTDCNLRCRHCRLEKIRYNMSLDEIEVICKKLAKYHTNCIFVSGGEPTVRADIVDVIKLMKRYIPVITLNTNGTLLDRKLIEELIDAGVNYFQISLDGLEKDHNEIRGNGTFEKTINDMQILSEYSDRINIHVSSVVSLLNIDKMEDFIKFLIIEKKLPLQIIGFKRYVPKNEMAGTYNLGQEGLKKLYESVEYLRDKYSDYTKIVCDFPQKNVFNAAEAWRIIEKYNLKCAGCSAVSGGPAIRTDGSISPCSLLDVSYGNILTDSIEDIYESEIFQNLMDRKLEGRCGECQHKLICGGCRAVAFLLTGDYLGEDLECFILDN